jgi:hypothetical protein
MVCMISMSPSALLCMAVQTVTRKFKVAEFYKLGEGGILSEDDPVELLDGQIMIMAPIVENHRAVVDALAGVSPREFPDIRIRLAELF